MPFIRIAPQVVESDAGFRISVLDRHRVEYRDAEGTATAEVEFGGTVSIYADSIATFRTDSPIGAEDILARMAAGIEAMDAVVEIVR